MLRPEGVALKEISADVRAGEVLGVAGIAGNGQSEFFAALSGEVLCGSDVAVRIDAAAVGREDITARRRRDAAFVPEERNGHAAAPDFSLSDNVILSRHATGGLTRGGVLLGGAAKDLAQKIIAAFDVRKAGPDPLARTLSGGNLQKFVVGREIMRDPKLLVINQPTWGVDAGAAGFIRQAIVDLAANGAAVVVISQDLDELLELADRLVVLNEGRASRVLGTGEVKIEEIGLLMGGVHGDAQAGGGHAAQA